MQIIPLTATHTDAYNAFLLRGLQEHPEAFRIGPEDVRVKPFPILGPDEDDFTLAAFAEESAMLGVVTFMRERLQKMRHKGWVVRMYVAPWAAGAGVGRALLRETVARATQIDGLEQLNLTVIASNARAGRLYLSEGFVPFARELRAVKEGSEYRDEEQMALRLTR